MLCRAEENAHLLLVSAGLGLAGAVAAVFGSMADYALSYLDETDKGDAS
jgi:hypothetical protein